MHTDSKNSTRKSHPNPFLYFQTPSVTSASASGPSRTADTSSVAFSVDLNKKTRDEEKATAERTAKAASYVGELYRWFGEEKKGQHIATVEERLKQVLVSLEEEDEVF